MNLSNSTPLSAGEKRMLDRGFDITTEAQFAVCYLMALGKENQMRTPGMSDNYAVECGMKQETFRRAVNKFKILIDGEEENEEKVDKEAIYPKIKEAYVKFVELGTPATIDLARTSFNPDMKELGITYQMAAEGKKSKYNAETKARRSKEDNNLSSQINSYVIGFVQQKGMSTADAQKKAYNVVAQQTNKPVTELKKIYKYNLL